jgi:predicted metal-binding membrane protein
MRDSALEAVLRRDRRIVAGAIGTIVVLAWVYVIWLAADMDMGAMDMAGFRMVPAGIGLMAPASAPWSGVEFALVFAMWAVMMIGMMAPSAAPMILMYARVGRQKRVEGKPLAATGWFAAGYLLAWIGFSLAATLVQWMLERQALLAPHMESASNALGAIVLMAAGVYQWTPLKDVCLSQCQSPLGFLMRHGGFRGDVPGCLWLGLRHGAYCVGCCWILMALLFVVGVMNVLWIALLTLLVLLEKVTPWGRRVARAAGLACIAAGCGLSVAAIEGKPAIVLQALGGWKDARIVRTYTHLAEIELVDHANAIRLPANFSAVPVSADPEVDENLNVISGVDEGIRTPNNRNHNPGLYR